MARRHFLILLLLAWFLLFAAFLSNRTLIKDQATKSVNFRLRSLQSSSSWPTKHHISARDDLKKIHKSPSGPNPVGNHRPPTRP